MKRLLNAVLAFVFVFGFISAQAQLTTITASSISMSGVPIAAGAVTFTPVNTYGTAIAFASGGGGLNSPTAFSCTITAGAITGTCQIPDAALTIPANILYSIQITNTGNRQVFTLQQVANVTGTTWPLDHYGPPSPTTNVQAVQVAYGTAAPPAKCVTPSFYVRNYSGGQLFICVGGTFVQITGSGSSYTFTNGLVNNSGTVAPTFGTLVNTFAQGNDSRFATNAAAAAAAQTTANSALQNASQVLLTQIPTSGLIGMYTHADCSHPYKDYSGNGNDGAVESGIAEPACSPAGLSYGLTVTNGWKLPSAVTSTGITYIFSLLPVISTTTNGSTYPSILQSDSTGGILGLYGNVLQTYSGWLPAIGYNTTFNKSSSSAFIPAASVVGFSIGSSSGDLDQLFSNGVEVSYAGQSFTTLASFNVGNLVVGGYASANSFFGAESVALVYNRKLTVPEHAQVAAALNSYTQNRSNMVAPIPLGTSSSSTVVCSGDSITVGKGVTNSWCSPALFSAGETVTILNKTAVIGKTLAAMSTRVTQEVITYFSKSAPKNTGYIFGGTNDLAITPQPVADVWNDAMRAIQNARWGNAKIVFMPMISRTANDTKKDSINALVNGQCSLYADYCPAPDDPVLYADGANSGTIGTIEACPGASTYFQSDCIHPTTAGQTLLGIYASNAYKQLYGSTQAAPTQVSTSTYTVTASDNYITATANSAITLYNCLGYSKFVHVKVLPGLTVTVLDAISAQTIDGVDHSSSALALTAGSNYTFQVVPGAPATGGCTWIIN